MATSKVLFPIRLAWVMTYTSVIYRIATKLIISIQRIPFPFFFVDNSTTWSSQAPPSLDLIKSNQQNPYYFGSIETPSPITNDPPTDMAQYTSNPNTHGFNVQILSTPIANTPNTPILTASSRNKSRNSVTDSGFKELGSSKFGTIFSGFSI